MKTIRDLIEELKRMDPDTPVLVSGYEHGFDVPAKLRRVDVTINPRPADYIGEFVLLTDAIETLNPGKETDWGRKTTDIGYTESDLRSKAFTAYVIPRPKTYEFLGASGDE